MIIKGIGGIRGFRTNGDDPNYYIMENGKNTEKSLGDLRRFTLSETPLKHH